MSFSARVKEELSHQLSKARHCQIAELAAILSLCGKIHIDEEDHFSIRIHTENVAVARKYFTLLKNTFNIKADISIRRNAFLKKSRSYTLLVRDHENALRVLEAVKMVDAQGNVGKPFGGAEFGDSECVLQEGIYPGRFSGSRILKRSGEILSF